ncbi:MAG: Mfa1 fimbrilin C-terminal domain-containing protein [Prevotella sp.]|nr:Mfa1 fimbrilin C-terminal domain-containing protein [Prevotella sp.]
MRRLGAYLLMGLTVGWLLTGCSDSDVADKATPPDILDCFNNEGYAYLSLDIEVPADNTMRAVGTPENGTGESDVKTVTLILFHGASTDGEDAVTVCSSYVIGSPSTTTIASGLIDKQVDKRTVRISNKNINAGDRLYALAVLNILPTIADGTSFSDVKTMSMPDIGNKTDGFAMANAPLSSKAGDTSNPSGATVTTLVEIPSTSIKDTEDAAAGVPTAIYVERAAVKVTAGIPEGKDSIKLNNTGKDLQKTDIAVALDRYNTSYHLTRQFDKSWLGYRATSAGSTYTYRMVEASEMQTGAGVYRTNWGKDANYDADATDLSGITDFVTLDNNPLYYCAENTFDITRQTLRNTTALIVRIKVYDGDFYTVSVEGSLVYTPDDSENTEEGTSASESFARRRAASDDKINSYLVDWLAGQPEVKTWLDTHAEGNKKWLKVEIGTPDTPEAKGVCTVTVSQTRHASDSPENIEFLALYDGLNGYVNSKLTIKKYTDGYCYYRVPIKHFGDSLTPWVTGDYTAENHLGRYGVVRNHWYDTTIEAVNRIGEPVIPPADDTRDDSAEEALSLRVAIMPWLDQSQEIKE